MRRWPCSYEWGDAGSRRVGEADVLSKPSAICGKNSAACIAFLSVSFSSSPCWGQSCQISRGVWHETGKKSVSLSLAGSPYLFRKWYRMRISTILSNSQVHETDSPHHRLKSVVFFFFIVQKQVFNYYLFFFPVLYPFCEKLIALCPSAGVALFIQWPSGPVILWRWTLWIWKRSLHQHIWFGPVLRVCVCVRAVVCALARFGL